MFRFPTAAIGRPSRPRSIVVISDFRDGWPAQPPGWSAAQACEAWKSGERGPGSAAFSEHTPPREALEVRGGYLERLPLAAVSHGLADHAEIWHFWRPGTTPPFRRDASGLVRRAFHLDGEDAPFRSVDMLGFIEEFGAPDILCVWALGVEERILQACGASFKI